MHGEISPFQGGLWWKWLKRLRLCALWDPRGCWARHWENEWHVAQWQKSVSGTTIKLVLIHIFWSVILTLFSYLISLFNCILSTNQPAIIPSVLVFIQLNEDALESYGDRTREKCSCKMLPVWRNVAQHPSNLSLFCSYQRAVYDADSAKVEYHGNGVIQLIIFIIRPTDLLDASSLAKRGRLSLGHAPESSPMFTSRTLGRTWMTRSSGRCSINMVR